MFGMVVRAVLIVTTVIAIVWWFCAHRGTPLKKWLPQRHWVSLLLFSILLWQNPLVLLVEIFPEVHIHAVPCRVVSRACAVPAPDSTRSRSTPVSVPWSGSAADVGDVRWRGVRGGVVGGHVPVLGADDGRAQGALLPLLLLLLAQGAQPQPLPRCHTTTCDAGLAPHVAQYGCPCVLTPGEYAQVVFHTIFLLALLALQVR